MEQPTTLSECGVDHELLLQHDWSYKSSATISDRIMQLAPQVAATLQPVSMQGWHFSLSGVNTRSAYSDFDCMIEAHTTQFYERPPITSFAAYRSYRTIMMVNIYLCATTAEHPTSMISRVGTSSDLLERPPIQAVHSQADCRLK